MSDKQYGHKVKFLECVDAFKCYSKHTMAMTAEGLHEKSDIAHELTYRDLQIERLQAENASLVKRINLCNDENTRLSDRSIAYSTLVKNLEAEVERLKAGLSKAIETAKVGYLLISDIEHKYKATLPCFKLGDSELVRIENFLRGKGEKI